MIRERTMITRRRLVEVAGAAALSAGGNLIWPDPLKALPVGTSGEPVLDTLVGKKPLIKLTYRAPNYETPIDYFKTAMTPNDAFFVRYHLSNIPVIDPADWRLSVGGDGANDQIELTFDDLKTMPATEVVAVNQCSGNRRGLFTPHVAGVQWGHGAMGCTSRRCRGGCHPEFRRLAIIRSILLWALTELKCKCYSLRQCAWNARRTKGGLA